MIQYMYILILLLICLFTLVDSIEILSNEKHLLTPQKNPRKRSRKKLLLLKGQTTCAEWVKDGNKCETDRVMAPLDSSVFTNPKRGRCFDKSVGKKRKMFCQHICCLHQQHGKCLYYGHSGGGSRAMVDGLIIKEYADKINSYCQRFVSISGSGYLKAPKLHNLPASCLLKNIVNNLHTVKTMSKLKMKWMLAKGFFGYGLKNLLKQNQQFIAEVGKIASKGCKTLTREAFYNEVSNIGVAIKGTLSDPKAKGYEQLNCFIRTAMVKCVKIGGKSLHFQLPGLASAISSSAYATKLGNYIRYKDAIEAYAEANNIQKDIWHSWIDDTTRRIHLTDRGAIFNWPSTAFEYDHKNIHLFGLSPQSKTSILNIFSDIFLDICPTDRVKNGGTKDAKPMRLLKALTSNRLMSTYITPKLTKFAKYILPKTSSLRQKLEIRSEEIKRIRESPYINNRSCFNILKKKEGKVVSKGQYKDGKWHSKSNIIFFLLKRKQSKEDSKRMKLFSKPILNVLVVLEGPEKWETVDMTRKPAFLKRREEALKMGLEANNFSKLMQAVNLQDAKLVEEWFNAK